MIKLVCSEDGTAFYFNKMKEVEKFKTVFEDHWCSPEWNPPVKASSFPEMDDYDFCSLQEKPKKRAKDDLDWAFALQKDNARSGLTKEQSAFVDVMMEKFSN